MITINKRQGSSSILKICQLQSQICAKLFQKNYIFDELNK